VASSCLIEARGSTVLPGLPGVEPPHHRTSGRIREVTSLSGISSYAALRSTGAASGRWGGGQPYRGAGQAGGTCPRPWPRASDALAE